MRVHLIYIYKGKIRRREYKNSPTRTSLLHHRCIWFKVAKFDYTDSNVSKTSFRDWPYNWPEVSFHKINFIAYPRADRLIRLQR